MNTICSSTLAEQVVYMTPCSSIVDVMPIGFGGAYLQFLDEGPAVLKHNAKGTGAGLLLGCSKCRGSHSGCVQCRDAKYSGKRWQR